MIPPISHCRFWARICTLVRQRVAQRVAPQHAALGDAVQPRRLHVLGLQHLDHAGPHHADAGRERCEEQRRDRQHELRRVVQRIGCPAARSRRAAGRRGRRRTLPTSSDPITNSGSAIAASDPIEMTWSSQRPREHGREHAEPERERDHQQRGDRREDERVLDRIRDQRPDRRAASRPAPARPPSRRDRRARARRSQSRVLLPRRACPGAAACAAACTVVGVAVAAEHDARGISRQELRAGEDHERGDEQRHDARPASAAATKRSTGEASRRLAAGAATVELTALRRYPDSHASRKR